PRHDLRGRRALNHAVDVDELSAQVLKGRATNICGPLSPANVDYAPVECYKHDPARAVALLREAGHDPAKLQLTLDTPSGRYPLDKDVSLAIAAQLQRLGITVNVVVNEWGTHLDKIKNRNTGDTFFLGWGPSLFGQGVIEPLFQASQTYSSYGNNPTIDAKIARAVTLVDPKARAAAYAELQKLAHDEAAWVPLWQQHDLYGVAGHVEGNITDQHRHLPPSLLAAKALRRAEECLMQGFTTVRDAGGADYGFREAVEEGLYPGPRLLVSGNYISQTGGHGDKRRRAEW